MKKIVCNVLYDTILFVERRNIGKYEMCLGLFEDKKDALISSNILMKVFEKDGKRYGIECVYSSKINEKLVPEVKMNNPMLQKELRSSVNDFVKNNCYIVDYIDKRGQKELQEIVEYVKENVRQTYIEDEANLNKV